MRGLNNISSLFSSFGTNSSSMFNFSDYAQIKNGSYRKLMKSYYSQQKEIDSPKKNTSGSVTAKKEQYVDKTGLSNVKKEADGMKAAAETLGKVDLWEKTDGKYDTEKITNAVKKFASEYNDVVSQGDKVNSTAVSQSMRYMKSMTNTMSKALAKVGVNVGTDGKLTVDEEKIKNADMGSVKSLFSGGGSYGAQMVDKASEIARATVMGSSMYASNGVLSSSLSSMFNKWI